MIKNCNPEEGSDHLYSTELRFPSARSALSEPILPSVLKKQIPNAKQALEPSGY